jgi:hypothetical protein
MKYRIKCITYANETQGWVVEGSYSFFTGWAKVDEFPTFETAERYVKTHTVVSETIINLKS